MKNPKTSFSQSNLFRGPFRVLAVCLLFAGPALAQTEAERPAGEPVGSEQRAELNLKTARENPLPLRHFLLGMSEGGALHNHLRGAVFAASLVRAPADDHLAADI